jgi:hypothetical protein
LPEVFFFDEMHPAQVVLIGQLHTAGRWLFARVQEAVCAPPLLHPNLSGRPLPAIARKPQTDRGKLSAALQGVPSCLKHQVCDGSLLAIVHH